MLTYQVVQTVQQALLLGFLVFERRAGALIHSVRTDQLVYDNRMLLSLTVQTGISLLKQFQIPACAEPNDVVATLLHV